jgi:hypothetical protein
MRHFVLPMVLLLAACQSGPKGGEEAEPALVVFTPENLTRFTPEQAVMMAASSAPRTVPGIFTLQVKASGKDNKRVYLNSELDYRDQRNLTISIDPRTAKVLAAKYGAPPEDYFKGKTIEVRGAARRVTIGFFENRRPTGLYYYQTHVTVGHAGQIQLVAPAS